MKCNLAIWDRTLRFLIGVLFVAWTLAGGPYWGLGGLYLLLTTAWGFCPLYAFFKISTLKIAPARHRIEPEE